MLLSQISIEKLESIITGFSGFTCKLKKVEIDKIFEECREEDLICSYDICFADYNDLKSNPLFDKKAFKLEQYVRLQLNKINGTAKLSDFILCYLSNLFNYTNTEEEVVEYLNRYFDNDGYSIEKIDELDEYKIYALQDCLVNYDCLFKESERGNFALINEHSEKCYKKIKEGDYSGAITNSRSLLEQILRELQREFERLDGNSRYNGQSIDRLLEEVLNKLNIKEGLIEQPLVGYTKLEEGFKNLTSGLSIIRHGMSDAHNISHPPTEKDALLIVNTAKTLANFIVKTYFEKFAYAA